MKFKQSSHIFEIKRVTTIKGNYNVELSTFMTPIVKSLPSYIKDSQHALVSLISLAKTNFFSLWILHLFFVSFAFCRSNIFLMNVMSRT